MPSLVKQSRLWHCERLVLTITVTPSICSAATSPIGLVPLRAPPNWMNTSFSSFSTLARASIGGPDCGPSLPPSRMSSSAPSPTSKASFTAPGSQNMAMAASFTLPSSSDFRMKVESEAAPPPALSDTSASTIGLGRLCELTLAMAASSVT